MALSINQTAVGVEEAVSRLQQQEMLPDVTRIACMHSVIVIAHVGFCISLLVHLLGDVEGLGGARYGDLLGIIK